MQAEGDVAGVFAQGTHQQTFGGGSEQDVVAGKMDIACLQRRHKLVYLLSVHTQQTATECGYPQPSLTVFLDVVNGLMGQVINVFEG